MSSLSRLMMFQQPFRYLGQVFIRLKKIINMVSSTNKPLPERKVLNDISISIKQGEVVGIIGRNGAEKYSTSYNFWNISSV